MDENPPLTPATMASLLLSLLGRGENVAVVVALDEAGECRPGARLLAAMDTVHGTLGEREADDGALELAGRALAGEAELTAGTYTLDLGPLGELRVFLELHHPSRELVIVGAGHLAQPLCTLGSLLGLRVTVLDDRPEFATRERFPEAEELRRVDLDDPFRDVTLHRWSHVVLVTRGHKHDYECLRRVLTGSELPGYIGMIGSRRRVRATFDALLREGIPREKLEVVHAPIGLDIGGETPAEIALSVAAELVHHWHGGSGRPLRELEDILGRFHPRSGEGGAQDGKGSGGPRSHATDPAKKSEEES